MQLIAGDAFGRAPPQVIGFGWKPDSPFRDQRLRQAVSLMLNRDDLIRDALTALRAWSPKSAAAIGWTAGNETRQLGQQTTRVSVLRVEVAEPDLCP